MDHSINPLTNSCRNLAMRRRYAPGQETRLRLRRPNHNFLCPRSLLRVLAMRRAMRRASFQRALKNWKNEPVRFEQIFLSIVVSSLFIGYAPDYAIYIYIYICADPSPLFQLCAGLCAIYIYILYVCVYIYIYMYVCMYVYVCVWRMGAGHVKKTYVAIKRFME